jgi:hypothetical protein
MCHDETHHKCQEKQNKRNVQGVGLGHSYSVIS